MNRMQNNPKNGAPLGSLLLGVSFYALAAYIPELTGTQPSAEDQAYLDFFKVLGGLAMLGGVAGFYKAWIQAQKRKEAEKTSGTFGEARFATLQDCAAAGLLDPQGLYVGLKDGQPLMRPEDILLMEKHQQLLLIGGMRPVLAQRLPFWFFAPWARWAAPNPVEGEHPQVEPMVRFEYRNREDSHE